MSIITVVYNAASEIRQTIESVLPHLGPDVEYILIDGGSVDGTVGIIREFEARISAWRSEPDDGIYAAMNKGAALAQGRFIYHLNVGDRLIDLPRRELRLQPREVACVAFGVALSGGTTFRPSAGLGLKYHNTLHHQGCFYSRAHLDPYNLRFRVFADFDLNQRMKKSGGVIVTYPKTIAHHDQGGISNSRRYFHEVYDIVKENSGLPWVYVTYIHFKVRGLLARMGIS